MKKIISALICVAMLTLNVFAYSPVGSTEVDDSANVYTYIDNNKGVESQTLTELGGDIIGTNWRMRNAAETPDGLAVHKEGVPAKYGINAEGNLFVDAVFGSIDTYNATNATTVPALVLDADLTGIERNHKITYSVKKHDNATVTTGIRFMVHNGGQNYYALIMGGNNYNWNSGTASWQLIKSVDGKLKTLMEGGHSDYPNFGTQKTQCEKFWDISVTVADGKISFKAASAEDSSISYGASCYDKDMFNVSGNDAGVWLMSMNGNNNEKRNASFKNVKITNYVPYITGDEPENVMYIDAAEGKNADGDGVVNLGEPIIVRKIIATSAANNVNNLYLSNDKIKWDKISGVRFDDKGVWINNKSGEAYSYVAFGTDMTDTFSVLTETTEDAIFELPLKSEFTLYPKAGEITDSAEFVWTSSRPDVAEVKDGKVSLLRKGDAVVTATLDDVSFACNIKVIGDIEAAIKNDTVAEYLSSVKPVFDEINKGIKANDSDIVKAVFQNTGDVKIADIIDIDSQRVTDLEDIDSFVKRIMTYKSFPCEKIEDVYALADAIDAEYAVGVLDDITSSSDMISELVTQNIYLGLDLENEYYEKYDEETAGILCDETFDSASDLRFWFKQAYVMAALNKALSPDMVEELVGDCYAEIEYDQDHFDDVKGTDLYDKIIANKSSLDTLEKLKDFIDDYTKPKKNNNKVSVGGGSRGGGGGVSMSVKVDSETIEQINKETLPEAQQLPDFTDLTASHWAYDSVTILRKRNIINGYQDGSFRPENTVTRAEFIKMLVLALNLEADATETEFSDVADTDWYYEFVTAGAQKGIITGYPDGSFKPDVIVSREEMAVMLQRAYKLSLKKLEAVNDECYFADAEDISSWAVQAVEELSGAGVLSGNENEMFEPARGATRAETAKSISALL